MKELKSIIENRHFELILENGKDTGNKILSYLNMNSKVEFNVTKTVSGTLAEASITIYGINIERMSYLSTSCTNWAKKIAHNKIILIAGFTNKPYQIYIGTIIDATPNFSNANFNIQLKCTSNYDKLIDNNISYSFKDKQPLKTILQQIAKDLKYNLVYSLKKNFTLTDYAYQNTSIIDHLRNIANQLNIDLYLDGSRIIAKEIGKKVDIYPDYTIDLTNIIGDIEPNNFGCKVKIRLNGALNIGQRILLKSMRFSQLDNIHYVIQTIEYEGDTRGQNWYSILTLIEEGIYDKN